MLPVHLAMRFQRSRILEINQSETRIACGGHVRLIFSSETEYPNEPKFSRKTMEGSV
jgi:hypothetical protein